MHRSINPIHIARGVRAGVQTHAPGAEQGRLPRSLADQAVVEEARIGRMLGKTVGLGVATALAVIIVSYLAGLANGIDTRIDLPTNTIWTALVILSGAVFGLGALVRTSAIARSRTNPVALGQALFHEQIALVLGFAASALGIHSFLSAIADGLGEGTPPPGRIETGTILTQLVFGLGVAFFAALIAADSAIGPSAQLRSARRRLLASHLRARITTDPTKNLDAVDRWIVVFAHLIVPSVIGTAIWFAQDTGELARLLASISVSMLVTLGTALIWGGTEYLAAARQRLLATLLTLAVIGLFLAVAADLALASYADGNRDTRSVFEAAFLMFVLIGYASVATLTLFGTVPYLNRPGPWRRHFDRRLDRKATKLEGHPQRHDHPSPLAFVAAGLAALAPPLGIRVCRALLHRAQRDSAHANDTGLAIKGSRIGWIMLGLWALTVVAIYVVNPAI